MRLMRDRGQRIRHGRSDTLSRLLKPLVQELDGTLPGQASSLGIIIKFCLVHPNVVKRLKVRTKMLDAVPLVRTFSLFTTGDKTIFEGFFWLLWLRNSHEPIKLWASS